MVSLNWHENRLWNWTDGKEDLARKVGASTAATIDAGLADCRRELSRLAEHGWPVMPLHGDYYEENLLIGGRTVTGIVDWDEFRVDWRAWEVSNALWSFCRNAHSDDFDRSAGDRFLAA